MRTNDQYFKAGDKVMRVEPCSKSGSMMCRYGNPQMGIVYCIEDFFEGPSFNAVMLVGFGGWEYANGMPVGWRAKYFRKVDEIKLCVAAVEHMKAPLLADVL